MENLNAEQIKKALECCHSSTIADCKECPYKGKGECEEDLCITCLNVLVKDALALITSQEQRIKELAEKNEKLSNAFNDLLKEAETYLKQREAFQSRVKYLEKENARLVEDNHILATEFKDKVKADTVQKFKSIIIENYAVSKVHYVENEEPTITYQLTNWDLRVIAKEMLEGEK